jgi:hypothetical protein
MSEIEEAIPCLLMTYRNGRIWNDRNWILRVMSLLLVLVFVPDFFCCTWGQAFFIVSHCLVKVPTEMKLKFKQPFVKMFVLCFGIHCIMSCISSYVLP